MRDLLQRTQLFPPGAVPGAGKVPVVVPQLKLVDFRESLVFVLLGVIRLRVEATALATVTGARADN